MRWFVFLGCFVSACTPIPEAFECSSDAQCVRGVERGRCEASKRCSLPDQACPQSGRRFFALSGQGACVDDPTPSAPPLLGDAVFFNNDEVVLSGTIDTSALPTTGGWEVGLQANGTSVAVLHAARVTVPSGQTVRFVGALPVAILARDAIVVDGVIDASAKRATPGPGGDAPSTAVSAGASGDVDAATHTSSGGGGGGHQTAGATGGRGGRMDEVVGGTAGVVATDAMSRTLRGGSRGGRGGVDTCQAAEGGAGGGAVFLFSPGRVAIGAAGGINVGGGGGQGGPSCVWSGGGGGGGSGGTVLIDAAEVVIAGTLAANGGGGGAGAGTRAPTMGGQDGEDGAHSSRVAMGGLLGVSTASATPGGAGGSREAPPRTPPSRALGDGGGGGGAVGKILIAAPAGFRLEGLTSPDALVSVR